MTKSQVGLGNVTNDAQVKRTEMGVASGVATLDTTGKVPTSQLPSYVDDVLEYDKQSSFPAEGETGKIYIAKDTNKTYRWSGSAYVEISASLALGETSSTAYAGDKGKANADAIAVLNSRVGDDTVTNQISTAIATKADTSALTSHTGDTTAHITAAERTKWNAAKTHADSTHAPSGAQANVIEGIKVNGTSQAVTNKIVDIKVPTDNKDLANGSGYLVASDIANKADKATTLSGYGITDAAAKSHTHDDRYYTESEINTKFNTMVGDKSVATQITDALANYYTKAQIDAYEFITVDDIDAICGTTIQVASGDDSEVTF